MYCSVCGSEIAKDAEFCGVCGTPVPASGIARRNLQEDSAKVYASAMSLQLKIRDERGSLDELESELWRLKRGMKCCTVIGGAIAFFLMMFFANAAVSYGGGAGAFLFGALIAFIYFCFPFGAYWLISKFFGTNSFSFAAIIAYLFFGFVLLVISGFVGIPAFFLLRGRVKKYEAAIAGQRAYIVNLESQAAPSAVVA